MFHELFHDDVLRLETRRLWLRWPETRDASALQDIASDPRVATMTASWQHPLPEGEALRRIARMRAGNAEGRSVVMAMIRKRRPRWLIGIVGLHDLGDGRAGVGYLQGLHFSGQGLMTEALAALLKGVLVVSVFDQVEATVRLDNPASRRVLEKCGFVSTGRFIVDAPARPGRQFEVDGFVLKKSQVPGLEQWSIAA